MTGILGPDFLLGNALGQFCSARRSVKVRFRMPWFSTSCTVKKSLTVYRQFKQDEYLLRGTRWTLQHAFFTDMGGMFLSSPDFPEGFPINTEQFHYLLKHDHIDFPNMNDMMITERNATDTLSR